MKSYTPIKETFWGGSRRRVGQPFQGPDDLAGDWFVPTEEYKAPAPVPESQSPLTMAQAAGRKAMSFMSYIHTSGPETKPEKKPRKKDPKPE